MSDLRILEYSMDAKEKNNGMNGSDGLANGYFLNQIIGDVTTGAYGNINHFLLNNYEEIRKKLTRDKILCLIEEYGEVENCDELYHNVSFLERACLAKMEVTQLILESIKENLDNYAKWFLMSLLARMYELHKNYYEMLLEMFEEDQKMVHDLQTKTKRKALAK